MYQRINLGVEDLFHEFQRDDDVPEPVPTLAVAQLEFTKVYTVTERRTLMEDISELTFNRYELERSDRTRVDYQCYEKEAQRCM